MEVAAKETWQNTDIVTRMTRADQRGALRADSMGLLHRIVMKALTLKQGRIKSYEIASELVQGKRGIEIGGPSEVFRRRHLWLPIYQHISYLDNCDFSANNTWSRHAIDFVFDPQKPPGKNILSEGSDLVGIKDQAYDFVLSSHNLEHFANPVKALKEWQRITVRGGTLVLVLPYYKRTIEHQRSLTSVEHMILDYQNNTPEADLTHIREIADLHETDAAKADFLKRARNNEITRCMHHHVFDESTTRGLLAAVGLKVLAVELAWPFHIFAIAQMPD